MNIGKILGRMRRKSTLIENHFERYAPAKLQADADTIPTGLFLGWDSYRHFGVRTALEFDIDKIHVHTPVSDKGNRRLYFWSFILSLAYFGMSGFEMYSTDPSIWIQLLVYGGYVIYGMVVVITMKGWLKGLIERQNELVWQELFDKMGGYPIPFKKGPWDKCN